MHKKLKSATDILKCICNNIPITHYKSLYYALFESHSSYCITVFGNICSTCENRVIDYIGVRVNKNTVIPLLNGFELW